MSSTRHDLWRLAHMAILLRAGVARLRSLDSRDDYGRAKRVAKALNRQIRRALVAYARKSEQGGDLAGTLTTARLEAVMQLADQFVDDVDQLARLEEECLPNSRLIEQGVSRPIRDLLVDWIERPVAVPMPS